MGRAIAVQHHLPGPARVGAALPAVLRPRRRLGRHVEGRLRPPQDRLGLRHLVLAERRAVRRGGVALGGGGIADAGLEHHQGGPRRVRAGRLEGGADGVEVVAVGHAEHLPAISLEAASHVLGEAEGGVAIDGDVIVVEDEGEPAESQVSGQRRSLARHPFHEIAVTDEAPDPVVHDLEPGTVEPLPKQPLRDGHPDRVPHSLAERPGGGLHARGVSPLGMPGCLRTPLPELPQVLERERIAPEMQQAVEEHGRVATGEHEAVTIGPVGRGGVEAEEAVPQEPRRGGERHRGPGVSGLGLLDRVHREDAKRVDHLPGGGAARGGGRHVGPNGGCGQVRAPVRTAKNSGCWRGRVRGDILVQGY